MYQSGKLNIPDHASSRFNLQYFTLWASVDKVDNGTVNTYIYCSNGLCDSETVSRGKIDDQKKLYDEFNCFADFCDGRLLSE